MNGSDTDRVEEALRATARGDKAHSELRFDEAESAYRHAIALAPTLAAPWFCLGIVAKWRCRWEDARWCAEMALALGTDNREGALRNLGTAATALGDWEKAREAWAAIGLDVPQGDGVIEMDLGMAPVRLRSNSEVAWCKRVDPVRAIIRNIPLPESGRRFGDMVLHDGEPNGHRKHGSEELPVFDEIQLLAPSGLSTYRVTVRAPSSEAIDELLHMLHAVGIAAEDRTASVRHRCRACGEGRPHEGCPTTRAVEWTPERILGIAALSARVIERLLERWALAGMTAEFRARVLPGYARAFETPECVLAGAGSA